MVCDGLMIDEELIKKFIRRNMMLCGLFDIKRFVFDYLNIVFLIFNDIFIFFNILKLCFNICLYI